MKSITLLTTAFVLASVCNMQAEPLREKLGGLLKNLKNTNYYWNYQKLLGNLDQTLGFLAQDYKYQKNIVNELLNNSYYVEESRYQSKENILTAKLPGFFIDKEVSCAVTVQDGNDATINKELSLPYALVINDDAWYKARCSCQTRIDPESLIGKLLNVVQLNHWKKTVDRSNSFCYLYAIMEDLHARYPNIDQEIVNGYNKTNPTMSDK